MTLDEFKEFLESLATDKEMEFDELSEKLVAAGQPSMTNVTSPVATGKVGKNLRRMTDTKLYTGAHKARFDEEGKGKGIEGRVDRQKSNGYVSGYKHKGSYDKQKSGEKKEEKKDKNEKKDKKEDKKDKKDEKKK